jgi:iduronate 2-sulfatase
MEGGNKMKKQILTMGNLALVAHAVGGSIAIAANKQPLNDGETKRPNVLFLISDDLNMRVGAFGDPVAKTPNLDRLAGMGVRFERAYCQFPLCNPSRASVMSGLYPTRTGVLDLHTWLLLDEGQQTMETFFESNGYAVELFGKVHHGPNFGFGPDETPPKYRPGGAPYGWSTPEDRAMQEAEDPLFWNKSFYSPYRAMRVPDTPTVRSYSQFGPLPPDGRGRDAILPDTIIADNAILSMQELANGEKPFFLAVGFGKPHTPLKAPARFFDLFDPELMPLPPDFATEPRGPDDTPPYELRQNGELYPRRAFTEKEAREAMQAYYACVSYMDEQLGRVLDELEKLGVAENTIIVFYSDHGFHLSEKGMWSKGTTFEASARAPMIIVDPRQKTGGQACGRIVEFLDMYPTLVDLCGLPPADWLEGVSLRPLLENPDAPWDRPAFTVQTRHWSMGRSIRTERWRYTEWDEGRGGAMLFDYEQDPNEMKNMVNSPTHEAVLTRLQKQLRESPMGQVPPPWTDPLCSRMDEPPSEMSIVFDGATAGAATVPFVQLTVRGQTLDAGDSYSGASAYSTTGPWLVRWDSRPFDAWRGTYPDGVVSKVYSGKPLYGGAYFSVHNVSAGSVNPGNTGVLRYQHDIGHGEMVQVAATPGGFDDETRDAMERQLNFVLLFGLHTEGSYVLHTAGRYGFDGSSVLTVKARRSAGTDSAGATQTIDNRWVVVANGVTYVSESTLGAFTNTATEYTLNNPDEIRWAVWTPGEEMSFGSLTYNVPGNSIEGITHAGIAGNHELNAGTGSRVNEIREFRLSLYLKP